VWKSDKKHCYDHVQKSVETNHDDEVTILWNQQVQTDRNIPNDKLDIIIRDNEKGTCMLIDVAISADRNVTKKETEKILKYKGLRTQVQLMLNVKTNLISIKIGANGTISESFRKYLSNKTREHEIEELLNHSYCALHAYFGKMQHFHRGKQNCM
jgi:hypothetical protein